MKAGVQSPVYATIGAGVVNCAFTVVSVRNHTDVSLFELISYSLNFLIWECFNFGSINTMPLYYCLTRLSKGK